MGTKHVLIVDDAIDLGRLLSAALKTANPGLPVVVVPSAEEAILESTRLTIDLLITDIRLPGITGLDLVRKIRVRQPDVKVMVISGLAMSPQLQKQIDDIHPDAFMHKPMSMAEFIDTTSTLLGFNLLDGSSSREEPSPQPAAPEPARSMGEADQLLKDVLAQALPGVPAGDLVVRQRASLEEEGEEPERDETGLGPVLSRLRGSLGAVAAILLDERGHRVAQAGDLEEPGLLEAWASPLAAALSDGARLSYLLGDVAGRAVQAYHGRAYDLVCAPVGQYTLLVVLRPSRTGVRMAVAFEEALLAQTDLAAALGEMGLRVRPVVEVGAPEGLAAPEAAPDGDPNEGQHLGAPEGAMANDPALEKLEELIAGDAPALDMDLDSFWDSAIEKKDLDLSTPGVLSFEQAQKLGLLPDQET